MIARHSARINGITSVAVTKLDVLDPFPAIKVCTAYRYRGEIMTEFPASLRVLGGMRTGLPGIPGLAEGYHPGQVPGRTAARGPGLSRLDRRDGRCAPGMASVGWRREETLVEGRAVEVRNAGKG